MKKILFGLLVLISFQSFGQVPTGYQKRIVNERIQGSFMVDSAFNIPRYADTTAANLHKRSDSCGAMFFSYTKDSVYYRACNPKRWIVVGSGDISGKLNKSDTAAMLANYLRGATEGYGIDISGTQHKTWSVDSFSVATRDLLQKKVDSLLAVIAALGSGGGISFDSLSMISITSYPGVSVQWTTGTITSGSPTLTVASAKDFAIGQWVTVEGAGAAGVNLRTTITNVVGTTITLNNNAGTSVTNKRLRHDCTPGIQMALNDAVLNPKKSTVYVPADTAAYTISGPLVTSVDMINPNAQLYIPLVQVSDKMVTVRILGSTPPNMASEGTASAPRNSQGCIFESTLTTEASGTLPCVLGTSYYTVFPTGSKNYINTVLENLIIRTATKNPAGTDIAGTMGGVNFRYMTQKYWNNLKVDISSALVDRVYPVNPTFGLYSPEVNNKAELDNGKIFVEGYGIGHTPGEHEVTQHYIGGGNVWDVNVADNYYNIHYTKYTGELNLVNIRLQGTSNISISAYETEHGVGDFPFEADIKQVSGTSRVHIWTSIVSQSGTGPIPGVTTIITSGSPNYTIDHGEGQNRFQAKLIDIALYPTDSLTGYWPLDNEVGDFTDTTGNGFDLARVNSTTTVASKVEGGANFVSASSQALTGSASNRLSAGPTGLTVGGWFRIATGATGTRALFSKWAAGQAEWTFYWSGVNNSIHFAVSSDGTNVAADIFNDIGGSYPANDSWHYVVGMWDGTNLRLLIDNAELSSGAAVGSVYSTSSSNIGVGNYPYGAGTTFDGGADELFVYRRPLRDEEITFLYKSGMGTHYLEGATYDIIDTTSSTLVLDRLRLNSIVAKNIPYNSGAGMQYLVRDTVVTSPTYGKFFMKTASGGYTNLTSFVSQNNWKTFYSNGSGDVTELSIGAAGTYLKSAGASSAPAWTAQTWSKGFFLETPGSAEAVDMWQTPVAITVSSLKAILRGSTPSVTYNVKFGTDITSATSVFTSDITCTSITTGCSNSSGFNDATIPAGSFIWIVTTAASGTITSIGFTLNYTED